MSTIINKLIPVNRYNFTFVFLKAPKALKYWDVNNLHGWTISQKLPLGGFKWVEETSQSNENFKKSYNEDSDRGYFLEVDVQYPEEPLCYFYSAYSE